MPLNLTRLRELFLDVPKYAKLAYCLLRDPQVPAAPKAALLGTLGVMVSPIDFPDWVPVLGELDGVALSVLAVKVFVDACPDELVARHEEALRRGDSFYHEDVRAVRQVAMTAVAEGLGKVGTGGFDRLRARVRALPTLEDRTA